MYLSFSSLELGMRTVVSDMQTKKKQKTSARCITVKEIFLILLEIILLGSVLGIVRGKA